MIDTSHMRTLLRGADMILQSAQEDGLPQVRHVALHDNVAFQVDTVDDLKAWAGWRGLTIEHRPLTSDPTREIIDCRGSMYEVPFEVYTSAPVGPPQIVCGRCSHPARSHTGIGCTASLGDRSCPCSRSAGSVELDGINAEPAGAAR